MIGLLISGGNRVPKSILEKYSKDAYIVCADGGIKNIIGTDIYPNLIVGDFDSINEDGRNYIKENSLEKISYPNKKDFTDTEAALEKILIQDIEKIIIIGATGTRLDHTFGNLGLLQKIYGKKEAVLIDGNNEIKYVEVGEHIFSKGDYKYISVISLSNEIEYSTDGFEYEVNHLKVKSFSTRGISNEIINDKAKLVVHSGRGYVIKSKD